MQMKTPHPFGPAAIPIAVRDALDGNWVDKSAPTWLKPYARLARWDRPIGWWLLVLPCWFSAALAAIASANSAPNLWHLLLFFIGAVAMRGAGCTYNDLVDRDIDAKVDRTRSRPLPSGQVTPRNAQLFMLVQALVGFLVLIQFNAFTVFVGLASLAIVAAYPFMKRLTHWPQSVLGLAFSWGALMGWSAHFAHLTWPAFALYGASVLWTIGYDTIYAHQDREDDALIGVKSTALLFGEQTKPFLIAVYGAAVALLLVAVIGAGGGWLAYLGLAGFAGALMWQIWRLKIQDEHRCLTLFRSNKQAGLLLFAGLAADALFF